MVSEPGRVDPASGLFFRPAYSTPVTDFGSVSYGRLPATHGTVTGGALRTVPSMNHVVRVVPMSGDVATGEASGVSSVSMNGVQPADGGNLANGYGINPSGTDGFVTADLASHAVSSFPAVTVGQAMGLAVDSAANLAVSPGLGSDGVGIYDLSTGNGTLLPSVAALRAPGR